MRSIVLTLFTLASCGLLQAQQTDDPPTQLADSEWQLVEFISMDDTIGVVKPHDPTLYRMTLAADGSVSMQLNCNRATGSWSANAADDGSSGQFNFGPLAMTRALCPAPSMDEKIARDSEYVTGYRLADGFLNLTLMADGGIYVWIPLNRVVGTPASPDEGGPRVWQVNAGGGLNMREQRSVNAPVVTHLADGTWLDNFGCEEAQGRVWCDVQPFGGGPVGYVAYEFLEGAVGPDGAIAIGPDDSALRAGEGMFDATGQLPCSMDGGATTALCEFGVARAGGGFATVIVDRPDGFRRALFFRMGQFSGADTSQADGYPDMRSERRDDITLIEVGTERYEISDVIILGD